MNFGEACLFYRTKKRLTLEDLSLEIGIPARKIDSIENNFVWPSLSVAQRISKHLGFSLEGLDESSVKNEELSLREQQVIGWVMRGLTNKQVADKLGIDHKTVKFHLSSIYKKYGIEYSAAHGGRNSLLLMLHKKLEIANAASKDVEVSPVRKPFDPNAPLPEGLFESAF